MNIPIDTARVDAPVADMMPRAVAEAALGHALDRLRDVCAERRVEREMVWAVCDTLRAERCASTHQQRRYHEALADNRTLRQQNAELDAENQRLREQIAELHAEKNVKPATVSPARASSNQHRNERACDFTT